ncbi:recombinase family protein [Micromonospora salmantinae]|uniref:recombinase family protein n=1 Tax=Micromonospora salmantinae TaxID=2911211 RepID=UPI0035582600
MPQAVIYLRSAYDRAETIFTHGERMCREKAAQLQVPVRGVFTEFASGHTYDRTELMNALGVLEPGDVFVSVDWEMISRNNVVGAQIRGHIDGRKARLVTVY